MSLTDLATSPTARSTKGRTPIFHPKLNGEVFDATATSAVISLGMGQHDVAMISFTSSTLTTTDGMLDSTLSFLWGQAPRTEIFHGYVLEAAVEQAGQGNFTFSLVLMGPSKPMQEGEPRFWYERTHPNVIRTLVYQRGLGYHGMDQPYVWEQIAQTSESDWTVINDLANKVGWVVFQRHGVIHYADPLMLFREQGSYATLRSSDHREFQPADDRRLLEFNPSEAAEDAPKDYGRKVAYFTENDTVQVAKQTGTFKGYRFVTEYPIRNSEEAAILTAAGASRTEEWRQWATARIWGDSDLYPGMLVDVVTTNMAYVRTKFDGRWLITKVDHSMDRSQFQTNLSLVRPRSSAQISVGGYVPFWSDAGRARPVLTLHDGHWRSSWTDPSYGALSR